MTTTNQVSGRQADRGHAHGSAPAEKVRRQGQRAGSSYLPREDPPAARHHTTEREFLLAWRPLLRSMASRMTTRDHVDELSQEGWIAVWRASRIRADEPWCMTAAKNRMIDVLRERHQLTRGFDKTDLVGDDLTELCGAATELSGIELAYHRGEILAALDRLSPREREYVELRFWGGWVKAELVEHFGYLPSATWQRARTKLAAELAHLAPGVG